MSNFSKFSQDQKKVRVVQNGGLKNQKGPGTDRSESVGDFQIFVGPYPVLDFSGSDPWIPGQKDRFTCDKIHRRNRQFVYLFEMR